VQPVVGIVMGSSSDLEVMKDATTIFERFDVDFELRVVSAHRTPASMLAYASDAKGRGLRVLIAGAGGAAHLPGMLASATTLPVIGVPVALARLDGLDSLLSIVQMPRGVPVATVAINGATNAALLALRILATSNESLAAQLESYRLELGAEAQAQDADLLRN
jgi:5-(carboxyamino)imidazole ribonucleotide mutase